jgi:hypothetical protein
MESLTLLLGMFVRIALPVGVLLGLSAYLRSWDQRRLA